MSTSTTAEREPARSAAYGIWVPCNRINFFHALEDRALLDLSIELGLAEWIDFGREAHKLDDALGRAGPASSTVRRLLWASINCGFEGRYRLEFVTEYRSPERIDLEFRTPVERIYELARTRGVDMRIQRPARGAVELSSLAALALAERQLKSAEELDVRITLTADGLQTWRARTTGATDTDRASEIPEALRVLIASMLSVEPLDLHPRTVEERRGSTPSDNHDHGSQAQREPDVWLDNGYEGLLPFFQLNILMGGLFYPGFKPDIFFERDPTAEDLETSNDRLAMRPPALLDGSEGRDGWASSSARPHHEHEISIEYVLDALLCTIDRGVPNGQEDSIDQALARTIDRFLTVTGDRALLPLKWRVERARRAILVAMLGVVHRKQHLTQMREKQPFPESFDSANEPQLRGYVTLVGAKLPLVGNVATYLDPIFELRQQPDFVRRLVDVESEMNDPTRAPSAAAATESDPAATAQREDAMAAKREKWSSLERLSRDWHLLLGAISTNVDSLTQAIGSAWQERVLYEQEQTRAEQEAMAEIERARVSSSTRATTIDSLFGAMVLVFTIAAFSGAGTHNETLERDVTFIAVGMAAVSVLWIVYRIRLGRSRRRGADQRHHYEMNLRLDRHTTQRHINSLLALDANHPRSEGSPLAIQRRGSYRVERISDEEAMHKIHVLSLVSLSPRGWRRLIGRPLKVPLSAIYEVLYHMPTLNGELLLREIRFTCYSDQVLTPTELGTLADTVASDLIDPFLEEPEPFSADVRRRTDPCSALFTPRPAAGTVPGQKI